MVAMSSDPTGPVPDQEPASATSSADQARDYLVAALRDARSAADAAGADPDAVTADLVERLRRLRDELEARQHPDP
jgi:hypothetical protein